MSGVGAHSLEGRYFVDATAEPAGDVGVGMVFEYHEDNGIVWARYWGGAVALGFLVGTRDGDSLKFRYTHVTRSGESASGRCESVLSLTASGLRLDESWQWESRQGFGTSVLIERDPPQH